MSLEPIEENPREWSDEMFLGDLVELPVEPSYIPQAAVVAPPASGPLFHDDFVLAETNDGEVIPLAPPDGLSPTERRIITAEPIPLTIEDDAPKLTQFTMRELLILMTFFSVGLSTIYYLPAKQVAGVLGLLALVGQGLLMRYPPENRHVNLAAWSLLGMYFIAAAVAFFQHVWS